MSNANLTDAKFSRAELNGADFAKADVRGANFRNTDLSTVKNLTLTQIRSAKVDETTKLPSAFKEKVSRGRIEIISQVPYLSWSLSAVKIYPIYLEM